jgi:hypothetical protein
VECFSAGVELRGHKYWHNFRVIEDLRFPFVAPDWTAHEEQLLIEGLEVGLAILLNSPQLFGICNWPYVAEYVTTKDSEECRRHYEEYYLDSPNWPNITFDDVCDVRYRAPPKRSRCPQLARKQRRAAKKQPKKAPTVRR